MHPSYAIFTLCITLFIQTACGIPYGNFLNGALLFNKNNEDNSLSAADFMASSDALGLTSETSDHYDNSSEFRTLNPSEKPANETDPSNSTSAVVDQSPTEVNSSNSTSSSLSTHTKVATLTEIFGNESQSFSSVYHSSSESSSTGTMSTYSVSVVPSTQGVNGPVTNGDEPEGVARGKSFITESVNTTVLEPESIYQKTLALISDTYTLSILVPVAAGVIFASTILIIIATCRCVRRQCRRRRLRRKVLPQDSVKNLRPSDRARLLAESSDEEF